jgi:fluoroquinolone transport system permease protein
MNALITLVRWDAVLQARNGFYWATAFVVVVIGALLLNVPEAVRSDRAAWVPALLAINLQITTFFFVAGLVLLERDEGTLTALAVSPLSAGTYLAALTITLTTLAAVETIAIVWIVFGADGWWVFILSGTIALGVTYTGFGAALGTRYESVNAMLLPASVFVTALLLPLLPHFGLAPRVAFLLHPTEPAFTLVRAGYRSASATEVAYGFLGSIFWSSIAYWWGLRSVARLMRDTRASGGR